MSEKKTIIGKVVEAILSVFKENWLVFIKKLWPKIPGQLQGELLQIVGIVNLIKGFSDLPLFDAIVEATATDKDDRALAWIRETATRIAGEYGVANKIVKDMKRGDWQTLGDELTVASTGMPYGQAAMSLENAYWNS